MTNEEIQQYHQKVVSEINKVKAFIIELEEATEPEVPDNAIGRISRMDAINNKSVVENSLRENKQKLARLQTILEKYGSSDFGKCTRCGTDIPFPG